MRLVLPRIAAATILAAISATPFLLAMVFLQFHLRGQCIDAWADSGFTNDFRNWTCMVQLPSGRWVPADNVSISVEAPK